MISRNNSWCDQWCINDTGQIRKSTLFRNILSWKSEIGYYYDEKRLIRSKFASIVDESFRILEIEINNVKLKFPKNSHVYSIVNISRVQLYFESRSEIFIESFKNDVEHDYSVDWVMSHKVIDGKHYYYIHWKDYSVENDIWESEENLTKEILDLWRKSIKIHQISWISQW